MAGYHVLNNELVWISYITKPYETIRIIPFSTSLHKGPMFSRSMASNMALNTGLEHAVALGATFSALACGSAPWVWLWISFPSIFAIYRNITYCVSVSRIPYIMCVYLFISCDLSLVIVLLNPLQYLVKYPPAQSARRYCMHPGLTWFDEYGLLQKGPPNGLVM